MKRILMIAPGLIFVAAAVAQESESTTITTSSTGTNLTSELWSMDDATVMDQGQIDLRLTGRWISGDAPDGRRNSGDDLILQPSIWWGPCANVEVFATVPIWVGDGGDAGPLDEGNADTTLGFTWRMIEPEGIWPALAIKASGRFPTGDNSNGVDGELRVILTNEYDSGLRSHVNGFAQSINGDNDAAARNVQWGVVLGMDGPLCADGAVRWVADYMYRRSYHEGADEFNMLEIGWEWEIASAQKLGMSFQADLDDNDDVADFGAVVTYSHSLTR